MFINEDTLRLDYQVEEKEAGEHVIDVLAKAMNISSRLIRKCKKNKQILVNHQHISVNATVRSGDVITVMLDHDENTFDPNPIEIEALYEDGDILAVNKIPFLVVHPTKGHPEGTLANALSYRQYKRQENYKIRFINRLDRDTSGVLLIAKNAYAQQIISEQMQANLVDKIYYAVVKGRVETEEGVIDAPIDRLSEDDILRGVIETGMPSRTHYKVMASNDMASILRLKLETGRTHQIRVHLQHIGHPIIGDSLYGEVSSAINRQALHCYQMAFKPPRSANSICVTADLPDDMKALIQLLGFDELKF
jgi:23S rRNA pseudouridine1911/1915/1917 synthase